MRGQAHPDFLEQLLGPWVVLEVLPDRVQDLVQVSGQRRLEVARVQRAARVVCLQFIDGLVRPVMIPTNEGDARRLPTSKPHGGILG